MYYMSYIPEVDHEDVSAPVKSNHDFSELLSRVERGEEILITKREQTRGVIVPLSPAAADTGTASSHRSLQ